MSKRWPVLVVLIMIGFLLVVVARSQSPPTTAPASPPSPNPQEIDKLLGPIALYPDPLLFQMLDCTKSSFQVGELNKWLKENPNLKGSELQDAADKKGFDPSFVAMSAFPDIVEKMATDIEWTKKIGQLLTSNPKAVLESIQRLRDQAIAAGNLKTTPQQEVKQEMVEGEEVVTIAPANPEVVYVPQYTETVYTTAPTTTVVEDDSDDEVAAGLIGFTTGILLGSAWGDDWDDDYYGGYGPYGWGGAYGNPDEFYEHREQALKERQQGRTERTDMRQEARTERQAGRQDALGNREGTRQANVGARQEARGTRATSKSNLSSRGYGGGKEQLSQKRGGGKSSAFSGYQKGSKERISSQRGRSSMGSRPASRGGGGGSFRGGGGGGGGGRGGGRGGGGGRRR